MTHRLPKAAWLALALCLAAPLALAGCGKKPAFVSPPEEVETDEFPRTYPTS